MPRPNQTPQAARELIFQARYDYEAMRASASPAFLAELHAELIRFATVVGDDACRVAAPAEHTPSREVV